MYLDFIRLNKKQEEENLLDKELLKETNEQLMNLSSKFKEFDTKTPKKLLCSLLMSKLILKYLNAFKELTMGEDQEMQEKDTGRKLVVNKLFRCQIKIFYVL